jgi:hypothetical protein
MLLRPSIQKNAKGLQKTPFLKFCMGDWKGPCDQCHIVTMASLPLTTITDMTSSLTFF